VFRVGFCVSGKGNLFKSAVQAQDVLGIKPALLITDEKAVDFDAFCRTNEIKYFVLDGRDRKRFDEDLARICIDADLDLLVLTFDKLLRKKVVKAYESRIINVHMGLLPSFKGLGALQKAIVAGVKYAGATVHEVNERMDEGSIVSQCVVSIRPYDTEETLGKRLYGRLRPMYLQVLQWYATERVTHDEQGRVWITDADYSDDIICPRLELNFDC